MVTPDHVKCANCGASMTPKTDGRVHSCPYCGAEVQLAISSEQIASGLALDMKNMDAFMTRLAVSMLDALGDRARVQKDGERIIVLELNLDPHMFVAKREQKGGVLAQYKKLVRGVALKTATHPLDRWVAMLMDALAEHANENARVAQALRGGK